MRYHWTKERNDEVRRLYGEGKSDPEIGEILGVSARAVECQRRRIKLTGPRRRREFMGALTSTLLEELEARGYQVTITTGLEVAS